MEDDASKRLYLHLIAFHLADHFSIRLPVDFLNKAAELNEFETLAAPTPSQMPNSSMFGGLKHYDFDYRGQHYRVDCFGLEYYLVREQYFYDREGVRIAPEPDNVVIDGGTCTGDTAAVFSNAMGPQNKVFYFDPIADHVDVLKYNTRQFPHTNVQVIPFSVGKKNVNAEPIKLNHYAPGFSSGNAIMPLRSLDVMVHQKQLPPMNYLKLNIEGAELDNLKNTRKSIQRYKPKLAVSLYHKPNDLFELILYMKQNFPFYACYIDHYTIHMKETVLYCRPH